ncbi:MAG: ABC transporter ATP-binding protein, partial [Muribaculaceae bacterium]|nr:ABC transporter ATP-binding protein [Muribaculaceae bacterium]
HDREFLDGLVEKVYEFGGGRVRECLGGIYEFLEKKRLASLSELERSAVPEVKEKKDKQGEKAAQAAKDAQTPAAPKLTYAEQRERDKVKKRAAKKVAEAEAEIARLEAEQKAVEARLAAGEVSADVLEEHSSVTRRLENAMSIWELAVMDLESLNG